MKTDNKNINTTTSEIIPTTNINNYHHHKCYKNYNNGILYNHNHHITNNYVNGTQNCIENIQNLNKENQNNNINGTPYSTTLKQLPQTPKNSTKEVFKNYIANQTIINESSNNINNDYITNNNKILNYQQQNSAELTTQQQQFFNRQHSNRSDSNTSRNLSESDQHTNQNEIYYFKTKNLIKSYRNSASILSAPVPLISGAGAAAAGISLPQNEISSVTAALENNDDPEAIKCIFLCEFHVTAGRKIRVQVPENYLSKEKFETVSPYIIPHRDLQRSFLCLSLLGIKILGYPIRIDNKQYARNAFYFNLCFVFAPTTRTIGYEPVVKKLSEYLLSMEKSCQFLSRQPFCSEVNEQLTRMFTQVRNDINTMKVCMLQEGSTLIPMCVVPRYLETVIVSPHHAAALTDDFYTYVRDQWDMTTLRILPYIDGFNHVNRITALSDVALELVCDCLRHLILLGVAVIVPVFQYSNIYRPTPKLSMLAKDRELQQKCLQRCSKSERKPAKIRDIFRFFASMAHGATFGELCVRFNPQALNINEKQMVLFGQLEGLIRRVEKFPVTVERDLYAEDVDNITKRKLGLVAGQIPNTPVFEQQQSQTSTLIENHHITPVSELSNNLVSDTIVNHLLNDALSKNHIERETNEDGCTITNMRKFVRLPSKPIPRSGRAAAPPPRNNFICHNTKCHDPNHKRQNSNTSNNLNGGKEEDESEKEQQTKYNGLQSFDEICSATGLSCQQLDYHLARDKHVIVLLK